MRPPILTLAAHIGKTLTLGACKCALLFAGIALAFGAAEWISH